MIALQSISLFWFSGCSRCVAEATVIGCTHLRQVWTAFYNGLEHSCDVWYLGSYFLSSGIEVLVPLHKVYYGRSAFKTYLWLAFSVAFLLHVLAKAFMNGCPGCWRTHGFKVEGFMARMNRDQDKRFQREREAMEKERIANGGSNGEQYDHDVKAGIGYESTDNGEEQVTGAVMVHEAEKEWELVLVLPSHRGIATDREPSGATSGATDEALTGL